VALTTDGAVNDNDRVDGLPMPFPSQELLNAQGEPVPVVPDEGVNVQDQPLLVPELELQVAEVEGQT